MSNFVQCTIISSTKLYCYRGLACIDLIGTLCVYTSNICLFDAKDFVDFDADCSLENPYRCVQIFCKVYIFAVLVTSTMGKT